AGKLSRKISLIQGMQNLSSNSLKKKLLVNNAGYGGSIGRNTKSRRHQKLGNPNCGGPHSPDGSS
ncbi:hypothetical protein, partial [Arenibacter nanhaiticus]|uniref:hypothetical protein n=1 Tax=Arenibacter nanhaiticus TaxID=558155 RepID=UPI001FEADD94